MKKKTAKFSGSLFLAYEREQRISNLLIKIVILEAVIIGILKLLLFTKLLGWW